RLEDSPKSPVPCWPRDVGDIRRPEPQEIAAQIRRNRGLAYRGLQQDALRSRRRIGAGDGQRGKRSGGVSGREGERWSRVLVTPVPHDEIRGIGGVRLKPGEIEVQAVPGIAGFVWRVLQGAACELDPHPGTSRLASRGAVKEDQRMGGRADDGLAA